MHNNPETIKDALLCPVTLAFLATGITSISLFLRKALSEKKAPRRTMVVLAIIVIVCLILAPVADHIYDAIVPHAH